MKYKELTGKIIGCTYKVYNQMGYGFLGLIINSCERKVEIKRNVRDFDEDLQDELWTFNPEYPVNPVQKIIFKSAKVLPFF